MGKILNRVSNGITETGNTGIDTVMLKTEYRRVETGITGF